MHGGSTGGARGVHDPQHDRSKTTKNRIVNLKTWFFRQALNKTHWRHETRPSPNYRPPPAPIALAVKIPFTAAFLMAIAARLASTLFTGLTSCIAAPTGVVTAATTGPALIVLATTAVADPEVG